MEGILGFIHRSRTYILQHLKKANLESGTVKYPQNSLTTFWVLQTKSTAGVDKRGEQWI